MEGQVKRPLYPSQKPVLRHCCSACLFVSLKSDRKRKHTLAATAAMNSSLLNRLRSTTVGFHNRFPWPVRFYGNDCYSKIVLSRDPNMSVISELDGWVDSGKNVQVWKLLEVIQRLRKQRKFSQAFQVSEWMRNRGISGRPLGYHSIQLDLIGKVHGLASAESYFNSLSEEDRTERVYCALLHCYIREHHLEKSLSHMQKMKELGFASEVLPYKDLMSLYAKVGQHEKVPDILSEIKENGILPDSFCYRICINSYGLRSDVGGMEKILEEMTQLSSITMDWNTYCVVGNHYISAGLFDKANAALKKAEEILTEKPDRDGFDNLFSLYGKLGSLSHVLRLIEVQKSVYKGGLISRDYCTFIGTLVKLCELEEAKLLLKEWELSGKGYDFRLPNVLLSWYCQHGLVEKAEELLEEILKEGKTPIPDSFGMLAAGYKKKRDMLKAVDYMKRALSVHRRNREWRPNPKVVKSILIWLGNKGEIEQVESFVGLLRAVIPMNREMYVALIKANVRVGKEVDELFKSMEADKIEVGEIKNWKTYSVLANHHINAGLSDKANVALKKAEEILTEKPVRDGFEKLFSLFGKLGSLSHVLRLIEVQKSVYKEGLNKRDYYTFIRTLVKLGELEEAELLLKEWELSGMGYDFCLPNVLLTWYCRHGSVEKAEELLEERLKEGKTPIPNSFGILAAGYKYKGDMGKAVDYMERALSLSRTNREWRPNPKVVKSILNWLGNEGEIEQVESFMGLLRAVIPMNREMYFALIKVNARVGKEVDGLLRSMEADKIEVDDEIKKMLPGLSRPDL